MSTAIERVEEFMSYHPNKVVVDDLTELLRLAKLGERVEQCEEHPQAVGVELPDSWRLIYATDLLAWLKQPTQETQQL